MRLPRTYDVWLMAVMAAAVVTPQPVAWGQGLALGLYQQVLAADSHGEKMEHGRRLGQVGAEGKPLLLRLLADDSYWNREAAVEGLLLLGDPEGDRALVARLLDDHMISDGIQRGCARALGRFLPLLSEAYTTADEDGRELLLDTIAAGATTDGERFLKQVVEAGHGEDRAVAFAGLIEHQPAGNRDYFLRHLADPELRTQVLAYLVETDGAASLPLMLQVVSERGSPAGHLVACGAVARFGDASLRQSTLESALTDDDEMRLQAALVTFRGVDTPVIRARLCELVRTAVEVTTRLLAGERLSELPAPEAIPCLIPCLRETLPGRETSVVDTVGTVLSAGFLRVLADTGEMTDRKAVRRSKERIAANLVRLAGVDLGTDYQAWLDWAVCNGHAVDGMNLVQRLYSGSRSERERAVDCACRLLGSPNRSAFVDRNPGLATEADLLLELTRRLLERGALGEEE